MHLLEQSQYTIIHLDLQDQRYCVIEGAFVFITGIFAQRKEVR